MRLIIAICVTFVGFAAANSDYDLAWSAWKLKYGKEYETSVEDTVRRNIWEATCEAVAQHNLEFELGLHTYDQKVGKFADQTREERIASRGGVSRPQREKRPENLHEMLPGTPSSIDWRNHDGHDYVTSVKDQHSCGGCWAFSAAGSTESQCAIKHGVGSLKSLSPQQCISCDQNDSGCNGGHYTGCFKWWKDHGGADTWNDYPYTSGGGQNGQCKENDYKAYAQVSGWHDTTEGSESSLENAVGNVGPTSVAIDASHSSFDHYSSGIYYEPKCSSTHTDHDVVVVGYNQNSQGKYWIVKNSWGTDWGQKGYIWMARDRDNNCGIAKDPSYPECGSISDVY